MDAQESPEQARGRRQQQYDSAFLPGSDDSQASHYNWVQICLMSAMGLAVGVMGTAAYVIWFSRDQVAYAEATQAARRPPAQFAAVKTDLPVPPHAAVPTSSVSGRVTPAPPSQRPASVNAGLFAATQPTAAEDDDTDVDAADESQTGASPGAQPGPQQAARPGAAPNTVARADRGKQPGGGAARHPQHAKPKETFVSRLTAMFRKVTYHRRSRDPGNNPDPYSHP